MAILKDLIVHGSSRFLNKIYASEIQTPLIEAEAGIIKKLKADDVTVVGLLDVQGQLHTNSWTNSNIATIDGSFYITPTLSSSSGTVSFSSATAATFTGSYAAVSSLYVGNNTASTVQWTSGSKILITGQVQVNGEWIPLGTLLGTLNSNNPTTSMPVVSITDNRNNTSAILTDIYSLKGNASLSYRNLKVSLYQRADSSKYYPLGIFMTALGQNGKTFLDIYGGVNELTTSYGGYANPNVRIGNLSGLPAITTTAGNYTPVGWGIYTTNGYFSGTIVSNTGVIGGWKLGASSLYNGTTGLNNTTVGIYLGTDGIRNYKDTDTYVNITEGVITAKGVNLTGTINATAGNIGGASITNGVLLVKDANISGKISANHIDASSITIGSLSGADNYALKEDVPTTVAELTDSGSYLTTSVASNTYATQTNLNNEINARKAVYGTSSTDAGTATKVVTCSNFALYTGASVTVTFSKTNTSSAPQLNVNSTGAKSIKSYTGANLTEGEYKWAAGASITFTYDGTNWRMQDGGALQAKIDAASSASTASSQAGVATQQATNATSAKTAAESAKTAAESAKTAAQSAKTAAETASSQASSAKDTAVSAKNDAISAKTDAQTAAGNASQSATDAANSATAAAEVMGGFTILWNYSAFATSDNGEGYLCAFDPATGTKSDANGWVKWNGVKRTITKQMINPNAVLPYNIPIYVVCRLSSATATTGTNYMVWYNSGWKYAAMPTPSAVGGSWTWADGTDIILGKFVETASEAALTEYEIYNPPYTSKQITTNVVTAQSASASAASAAQTATTYITNIDSNKGITIKPADASGNDYLQMNSSAINFYRNNVETLKIEDSAIRIGKLGNSLRNVYITDSAVQIRNNTSVLAEYGDSIKLYKPTTTTTAVEISSSGASFTGNITATSLSTGTKTASTTGKGTYIDENGNIYVGDGNTNNFTVTNTGTITATGANLLTATIGNATNKITIGTGTSGHSSIRYGMTTLADTSHDGFYIGTDGIALGKGTFKVTAAGDVTATSLSIGINQVTNLQTTLEGKQAAGDYATNTALNNVSTTASTALNQSVEYIKGTQTGSGVAAWTGVTTESTLRDGKIIMYYLPVKSAANVTLNLTLADNTTTGAIPVYLNYSTSSNDSALTRVSTHYPAGSVIQMTYDGVANQWKTTGYNTNVNTNTIGTLGATKLKAGTNASNASAATVYRWTLIMKKTVGSNPTWVSLVTSSSNGTSKTRYTGGLYPDQIFYMSANYSSSPYGYSTGATIGDSYAALGFDLRYSTNCGSTLVIGKPVYLVGEINPLDGLFYLDSTWWTQTEPTTENGKTYIYLGNAYSTTNIYLVEKNHLMRYYRGAFRTEEEIAGMTATSYITYINANDGIKVHNESDTLNYLQLNSDAISMFRDSGDGIYSDEVLRIDDTGIRVGKANEAHFSLTNDKLAGCGDVENVYFEVGKSDNTTIQLFYGNGERTGFEIGPLFKTIYYVKKNDITLTEGTDYEIDIVSTWYKIYFKTAPALNSTISVTYKDFYKSFIYTIGSSSSGDITVTSQQNPYGTVTKITIQTHKAYEAESIYRKKSGVDHWTRFDLEGEQISGTYRYSFYLDDEINTGDQIKIDYSTEKHSDLTPDTVTENYIWDATYQNSTLLTIRSAIQILSVSVNNTVLTENQDYTLDGLLKYGYLIFYNAPAVNEKIEMKFAPEEYNFEYQPTYFNFSNTNLENSVKGIGAASFGSENVNKGIFCFIEGSNNIVTGYASHVEGSNNVAAGSNSHVGGSNSLVLGQNTFAYGDNLQATYLNSAAFGHYNSPDNQLFSIGKGGYENAFSINKDGNIQFGGRLLTGTTYADKKPLFKIVERTFTAHGLGGNGSMAKARDISISGYKPIASLGYVITNSSGHPTSSQTSASWCILSKFWIGYDYTQDHQNYKTDSIYYYIWNLNTNTSRQAVADVTFRILYISQTALVQT